MNTLTVLTLAIVAACSSGSIVGYPGLYTGHLRHGYSTAHVAAPQVSVAHAPLHYNHVAHTPLHYNHAAPVTYNTVPYAPVAPIQSQYHAQDELGQYSFGYAGGPSSRVENRDAYGVVRGSYNYVDSEGKLQTQHYVADALGFRVSGTNLPVSPDAPEAAPLALPGPIPEPVQDTPEVAAAKAAHQAAYDEAAAAAAAAPDYADRKKRSVLATHALGHYSPLRFSYGFSAPLTYGHPLHYGGFPSYHHHHHATPAVAAYHGAVAPALAAHVAPTEAATPSDTQLLRVVNTPHHAVSYRVH